MSSDSGLLDFVILAGAFLFGLVCWRLRVSYDVGILAGIGAFGLAAAQIVTGIGDGGEAFATLGFFLLAESVILASAQLVADSSKAMPAQFEAGQEAYGVRPPSGDRVGVQAILRWVRSHGRAR